MSHFQGKLNRISSAEKSDSETSGRIVVGKLENHSIKAEVHVTGCKPGNRTGRKISLVTDTGVSKTLLNCNDWEKIKDNCKFVKTSKRFRPF